MSDAAKIYCVGGAVRDRLLGLQVSDHDWVVVGSTPEAMAAQGYVPVGKDFPVFLHPETHEEYALARTERKTASGYKGFAIYATPEVTLEEDLMRRDFTVNAIAEDGDGNLIDPYHGVQDLRAGILRHVSSAFNEDPVRILRGARFAARFGFTIAPETLALMRDMVNNGEVDALIPERVWQELARGLMEKNPARFFETLRLCGALQKIMPEVDALFGVPQPVKHHPEIDCGVHTLLVVDEAARNDYALEVRFAALTHDLGKATTPKAVLPRHIGHEVRGVELVKSLAQRVRASSECRDLALLAARYHGDIHRAQELRSDTVIKLFQSTDAWRRPARFEQLLQACRADARGRWGHEQDDYPQADYLLALLAVARAVDAGAIAAACTDKAAIPAAVQQARIRAIDPLVKQA